MIFPHFTLRCIDIDIFDEGKVEETFHEVFVNHITSIQETVFTTVPNSEQEGRRVTMVFLTGQMSLMVEGHRLQDILCLMNDAVTDAEIAEQSREKRALRVKRYNP